VSRRSRRLTIAVIAALAALGAPQAAFADDASGAADDIEVDGRLPGGDESPASPQTAVFLLGAAAALSVLVRRSTPRRDGAAGARTGDDAGNDGGPVLDLTDELPVRAGV
jgi:hypothetical protein